MTETGIAVETHRGFTLDLSSIRGEPDFDARREHIFRQVDIVADCGLKEALLKRAQETLFLASRNSAMIRECSAAGGPPDREQAMLLSVMANLGERPISATARQELQIFYGRALAANAYPRFAASFNSLTLYFALTATAFLLGQSHGLKRERIEKAQPTYFKWLETLLRDPEDKRTLN